MSFSITTNQVRNQTKTVTRRLGWWKLKPGDVVCAVEKGMGLKKGEKVKHICQLRIISVRKEPLFRVTDLECIKEGFPKLTPVEFMRMFKASHRCEFHTVVNRIEFEYVSSTSS
ncbi:MAG: ASCH domain-containing protein [Candidatus Eisenbacteria bacterium]|uniref:ASCH domain-containing protein n=1 Tax=Eiseniibacteriota bacterium TaxID=2212470 RepID=A0A948RW03_UNCEI|nr:ASCH domain-containing protein [Candidatus Eisenbacteria bacterium]MBU1947892.1 ASCH domain-containing protein [Candidatus Eisenbacteria bacterium]MBU2691890.1 ASCH domain-containing protein [Candidatus Eisenbacteria bacterium]